MKQTNIPERNLHKKLLIGGIVGVFVVIGLLVAGWLYADHKASSYQKAFGSWNKTEKSKILAQATVLPENLYTLAGNEIITKPLLAQQTEACSNVVRALETLKLSHDKLPVLSNSPLSWPNPSYRKAVEMSEKRQKVIDTYTKKAHTTLSQTLSDCQWSNKVSADLLKHSGDYQKATSLLMKAGASSAGLVCQNGGCLPNDAAKIQEYAIAYEKSAIAQSRIATEAFDGTCAKTTLKPVCQSSQKIWQAYQAKQQTYLDTIKKAKTSVDNDDIAKAIKTLSDDTSTQQLFDNAIKQFPRIKAISNLNKDTLTPETILMSENIARIVELKKQSKELEKL